MLECNPTINTAPIAAAPSGVVESIRRIEFADGKVSEEVLGRSYGAVESSRQVTELWIEIVLHRYQNDSEQQLIVLDSAAEESTALTSLLSAADAGQANISTLTQLTERLLSEQIADQGRSVTALTLDLALSNPAQLPKALETIKQIQSTLRDGREIKIEKIFLVEDASREDSAKTLLAEIIPTADVQQLRELLTNSTPLEAVTSESAPIATSITNDIALAQIVIQKSAIDVTNADLSSIELSIPEAQKNGQFIEQARLIDILSEEQISQTSPLIELITYAQQIELKDPSIEATTTSTAISQPLTSLTFSFDWSSLEDLALSSNTFTISLPTSVKHDEVTQNDIDEVQVTTAIHIESESQLSDTINQTDDESGVLSNAVFSPRMEPRQQTDPEIDLSAWIKYAIKEFSLDKTTSINLGENEPLPIADEAITTDESHHTLAA